MKYHVAFEDLNHGDIEIGLSRILDAMKEKPETLI